MTNDRQDSMTKRERVAAALRGDSVDRVPVSAWRHFLPEESSPEALAAASLAHWREFDWDWLKVNPRATYYAEAWDNQYDYSDYTGVYPRLLGGPIASPADVERIQPLDPMNAVFAEQYELLRLIGLGSAGAPFIQTVFSPLSVLSFLAGPLGSVEQATSPGGVVSAQEDGLRRLMAADPAGVHGALSAIAVTLAAYSSEALNAGASGIFFAITKLDREGVLSRDEYAEFGVPYDLRVLRAVSGASFNMLHTCGADLHYDQVADYPVHAINWATTAAGNPDLAAARGLTSLALVGGVDETNAMMEGTPDDVARQVAAAIAATGGRHFLLSPGCSVNPATPAANFRALRLAAGR